MGKLLRALKNLAIKFGDWFRSEKSQAALAKAFELVPQALSVVEIVAHLTPTRADDELAQLFRMYAIPYIERYLGLPREQRGEALKHAAVTMLKSQAGTFGVPEHILGAAIELALVKMRADLPEAA